MDDEHRLLAAYAQRGDEAAFTELVRKRMPLVYGLAFRELRDHHYAEEVTQNVFAALANAAQRNTTFHSLGAWLFQVTRRQAAQVIRSEIARRRREEAAAQLAHDAGDVWEYQIPELTEAIADLSEHDQHLLFLRFYEGHSFKEIAQILGIRQRAAQKRTSRTVDRLRAALSRRGVAASAGLLGTQLFTTGAALPPDTLSISLLAQRALEQSPTMATAAGSGSALTSLSALKGVAATVLIVSSIAFLTPTIRQRFSSHPSSELPLNPADSQPSALQEARSGLLSARSLAVDAVEQFYQLPETDREPHLAKLLLHLQNQEDPAYLTDVYQRWSALDPRRMAEEALALYRTHQEDEALASLFGELITVPVSLWHGKKESDANAWVKELPRKDYAESFAFEAILLTLAKRDVNEAFAWLVARPYNRKRAYELLATEIADRDTETALSLLETFPDIDDLVYPSNLEDGSLLRRDNERPFNALAGPLLAKLYQRDQTTVCEWLADQPDSEAMADVIRELVEVWAHDAPQEAADWASQLPQAGHRLKATCGAVNVWAASHPEAALAWALAEAPSSLRWEAGDAAIRVHLKNNDALTDVQKILVPLADQPEAARLFAALADALPLDQATVWLQSLPKGSNRDLAVEHVYYRLGQSRLQLQPTIACFSKTPQGHIDSFIASKALAMGALVSGQHERYAVWKESVDSESDHFYGILAAEASVLGAFNPAYVANAVLDSPSHPCRTQVIRQLAERSMHRSEGDAQAAANWAIQIEDPHQRAKLLEEIEAARQAIAKRPPGVVLPEISRSPLEKQPLDDLKAQLATLASFPIQDEK